MAAGIPSAPLPLRIHPVSVPPTAALGRVLAIDPSLRSTGYAVLQNSGGKVTALEFGIIKNVPTLLPSGCLVSIHAKVRELIEQHRPEVAAFESIIFVQSMRTAITLGTARGAALLAAAQHGLCLLYTSPSPRDS